MLLSPPLFPIFFCAQVLLLVPGSHMPSRHLFRLHRQNALRLLPFVVYMLHLLLKEEFVCGYHFVTKMSTAPLRRAARAAAGVTNRRAASSGDFYSSNGVCRLYAQPAAAAQVQAPWGLYVGDFRMTHQPKWGVCTPQPKHSARVAAPSFWGNRRHSAKQPASAAAAVTTTATTDQAAALASALAGVRRAAAAATRAGAMAAAIAGKLQSTRRSTSILTRQWSAPYGPQPQTIHRDEQRRSSSLPHAAAARHSLQQRRTLVTEVRTLEDFEEVRRKAPAASPASTSPPPPAAERHAEGGAAATAAAAAGPLKVVQFSASWCGPCKRITPVVQKMSEEWPSDKVRFYHVDIDDNPALAEEYNVATVPTFFFFKNGQVVNSISGSNAKALQDAISRFMKD